MDYNFVTVDRFMELEKSGALLESGTYEGKRNRTGNSRFLGNLPRRPLGFLLARFFQELFLPSVFPGPPPALRRASCRRTDKTLRLTLLAQSRRRSLRQRRKAGEGGTKRSVQEFLP